MTYSVDITGQKVFKGGYYEIVRKNTDAIIFRLAVNELEFGIREDGRNFCRVWGEVATSPHTLQKFLPSSLIPNSNSLTASLNIIASVFFLTIS